MCTHFGQIHGKGVAHCKEAELAQTFEMALHNHVPWDTDTQDEFDIVEDIDKEPYEFDSLYNQVFNLKMEDFETDCMR